MIQIPIRKVVGFAKTDKCVGDLVEHFVGCFAFVVRDWRCSDEYLAIGCSSANLCQEGITLYYKTIFVEATVLGFIGAHRHNEEVAL